MLMAVTESIAAFVASAGQATINDTESRNEMVLAVAASFAATARRVTNNDTESRNESLRTTALFLANVAAFAASVSQALETSAGAPPTPN